MSAELFAELSQAAGAAPRVGAHSVLGSARRISLSQVGFGRAVTCESRSPYTPLLSASLHLPGKGSEEPGIT